MVRDDADGRIGVVTGLPIDEWEVVVAEGWGGNEIVGSLGRYCGGDVEILDLGD